MDGGTFSTTCAGWIEVNGDEFSGSLMLPVFKKPVPGLSRNFAGFDGLPAGVAVWYTEPGTLSRYVAVHIKTEAGYRYFLRDTVEVLTHAQAIERLGESIRESAEQMREELRHNERAAAAAAGMSVERYRHHREFEERRKRHRRAAERHDEWRERLASGVWKYATTSESIPIVKKDA